MEYSSIEEIHKQLTIIPQRDFKLSDNSRKFILVEKTVSLIRELRKTLLPEYFNTQEITVNGINNLFKMFMDTLLISKDSNYCSQQDAMSIMTKLPNIREILLMDIEAAFTKDPAAKSYEEIALTYPGVFAIVVHRISHLLYKLNYNLLARMLSEHAHSVTGIDIHPGATIGHSFFIDHGTGVVIGETSDIGNNVTIYQNVTLGAFSFQRDNRGELIKDTKRHPTIEDNVTIYAGATILGGETIIGKGSVIGGNVWLTESVLPHSKVVSKSQNEILYPPRKVNKI